MRRNVNAPSKNRRGLEIAGALISGLCVGYFAAWVRGSDDLSTNRYVDFMLRAGGSFLVVTLLIPELKGKLTSRIPRWVLITLAGALTSFLSINLVGDLRHIMTYQAESSSMFATALVGEVGRLLANVMFFSAISLPIMAIFHQAGLRNRKPLT